jgi:hypothetical protein
LQTAEKILNAFEVKVPRKLCGPVLGNGQWWSRYDHEIYILSKEVELTRNIRLTRLGGWAGLVLKV